jgi:hypothetical protein
MNESGSEGLLARPSEGVQQTGLLLRARSRWGALPPMIRVRVQIDNAVLERRRGGQSYIPLFPGQHVVRCFYRWGFFSHAGDASIPIEVAEGQTVALDYRAGLSVFSGQINNGDARQFCRDRQAKRFPRLGAALTGCLGVLSAANFFTWETPPTTGHVIAGIVTGVSGLVLIAALLLLKQPPQLTRSIILGQVSAAGLLFAVFYSQRVSKDASWWTEGAILILGPLLITVLELLFLKRSAAKVATEDTVALRTVEQN